jgi:hypothetical protein
LARYARFVIYWKTEEVKMKPKFRVVLTALSLFLTISGASFAKGGCLTECSPRFGIVSAFGAEADILLAGVFLANPDYRAYVSNVLQGQSFDMETTAFAHVAYANEVPFIAFRSLSDLAGGGDFGEVGALFGSGLAEANASAVTLDFLTAWANSGN